VSCYVALLLLHTSVVLLPHLACPSSLILCARNVQHIHGIHVPSLQVYRQVAREPEGPGTNGRQPVLTSTTTARRAPGPAAQSTGTGLMMLGVSFVSCCWLRLSLLCAFLLSLLGKGLTLILSVLQQPL
jgi:hypothetical protein